MAKVTSEWLTLPYAYHLGQRLTTVSMSKDGYVMEARR